MYLPSSYTFLFTTGVVNCQYVYVNGSFWFDNSAIACARPPNIPHGRVQCLNDQIVYGSMCEAVCDDGFQVRGMRIMGCDYKGQWGTSPSCKGKLKFVN